MTNSFNREILIQEQNKLNTFGVFFKYINADVPNALLVLMLKQVSPTIQNYLLKAESIKQELKYRYMLDN